MQSYKLKLVMSEEEEKKKHYPVITKADSPTR